MIVSSRIYLYDWGLPSASRKEVVIIKDVLPHAINVGYHKLKGAIVQRINGVSIGEMRDVVKALEKAQGEFHVIELDHRAGTRMESDYSRDTGTRLVLRTRASSSCNGRRVIICCCPATHAHAVMPLPGGR
jgi:hypothetical protein